jgi:senataxin
MDDSRLVLLQGPPGTGKTKTIIGIVMAFLDCTAKESREPIKRPRVFVCAPSNAAADEIALRIMHERGGGDINDPSDGIPVVRVGDPRSVHELVKPVHLEVLIEGKLADGAKQASNRRGDQELRQGQQEEHRKLNEEIGQLHVEREKLGPDRYTPDYEKLTGQLTRLHSRKDEVVSAMNASFGAERRARAMAAEMRLKAKLDILNRAQVVCCTLSASGSETVGDGVRGADLIIIDEAAQATEVSTLIPLKHLMANRGRCVLVGDPCQLPATVLSQAAQSLRYERSLFERLHKCKFPVVMLDTQYRMHPAIRCFPSSHFYQNRLLDSPSVQSREPASYTARVERGPCVFWDVHANETRRGMSWCNTTEAEVVVRVCPIWDLETAFA